MAKKILVVTAHPDDMEIGCSGTLKKFQDQGSEIISIVTIKPSREDNPNRSEDIVKEELRLSYQKSNFELRILDTDTHPNGRPNLICNNITIAKLKKLVSECDLAIIPNLEDSHQDHVTTYNLIFPLIKSVPEIWSMHSWPYFTTYKKTPTLFVNIDSQINFKESLLNCYQSYINKKIINDIKLSNQFWGLHVSCKYAEAFTLVKKYVN